MTTKTIIRKSTTARFGYEWVEITENGENVIALNKKTTDDYLHLPENPFNRRLIGIKFLDKQGDEWEVTYRDAKPRTTSTTPKTTTPKNDIREFMTDDEKAIYDDLMKKVENRMKRAAIIAQIEALQKELGEEEA